MCNDLEFEKEKLKYSNWLEISRILLDRVVIGIFILILSGIAIYFGNKALEDYRYKLIEHRFLFQKQLEAIKEIANAYSELNTNYGNLTYKPKQSIEEFSRKEYEKAIDHYIKVLSKWSVILSNNFSKNVQYYGWIHSAILIYNKREVAKFRRFIDDLHSMFDILCKEELSIKIVEKNRFYFEQWSFEKAEKLGNLAFLEANFIKWEEWKKKSK